MVYTYPPGRAHRYAIALLSGYRGIVQCDGYGAYKRLAGLAGDNVMLAFCWSHLPRVLRSRQGRRVDRDRDAVTHCSPLPDRSGDTRRRCQPSPCGASGEKSIPGRGPTHLVRGAASEAARPPSNGGSNPLRTEQFLADGRIELDTNTIERAMKPIILSRKNSLFAGSDEGGANWACMASLIETCKLNQVNPQVHLTGLLTRLVGGWPQSRIDELMPWHHLTLRNQCDER